jgi:hypothetical protein
MIEGEGADQGVGQEVGSDNEPNLLQRWCSPVL